MFRRLMLLGLMLISTGVLSAEPSTMSLLNNRFRVDETINQITFVVYREKPSRAVVLVRPDGTKYYADHHPDNVRWYQESSMDIISIESPMPGPWQAIGKVTPENNIKLISHLALTSDELPHRMYQWEEFKFTARLTSDDKPLDLRDFLDRVNLKVTFTKFVENEQELPREARPEPFVIGEFADNGQGLDEKAGDGIFTVSIQVSVEPGKYRARITSGNGVFLRAQEQDVLVYPTPITTTFIQSYTEANPHHFVFTGEEGAIQPGSVLAHVEMHNPYDDVIAKEGTSSEEGLTVDIEVPYSGFLGNYRWRGRMYATELTSQRPLQFSIPEKTFSIVKGVDIEQARLLKEQAAEEKRKLEEQAKLIEERAARRKTQMIYIGVGNVVALVLALVGWFIVRKFKRKKEVLPEMQLEMPKEKK